MRAETASSTRPGRRLREAAALVALAVMFTGAAAEHGAAAAEVTATATIRPRHIQRGGEHRHNSRVYSRLVAAERHTHH
jgi:hypothetical protein